MDICHFGSNDVSWLSVILVPSSELIIHLKGWKGPRRLCPPNLSCHHLIQKWGDLVTWAQPIRISLLGHQAEWSKDNKSSRMVHKEDALPSLLLVPHTPKPFLWSFPLRKWPASISVAFAYNQEVKPYYLQPKKWNITTFFLQETSVCLQSLPIFSSPFHANVLHRMFPKAYIFRASYNVFKMSFLLGCPYSTPDLQQTNSNSFFEPQLNCYLLWAAFNDYSDPAIQKYISFSMLFLKHMCTCHVVL